MQAASGPFGFLNTYFKVKYASQRHHRVAAYNAYVIK
jgi:hypothetical protein